MKFSDFNFEPAILSGIESMGFDEATPVQADTIPVILENSDLIACAQTGTGKTAAFLLPVLNKLIKQKHDVSDTLIMVPTRELALQIDQVLQGFAYFTNISSIAIYGGSDGTIFEREKFALENQTNIIVATPGRLLAHLKMGYVSFANIRHFILDEADRMLDMGFLDDITTISSFLPKQRQTIMFSATMPMKIRELAKKIMNNPKQINIAISKPPEGVIQVAYLVEDSHKNKLIQILLKEHSDITVLIFASTKLKVKSLVKDLNQIHIPAKSIHSDLEQTEREEVLRNFKNRQVQILVATDILSRGIDIEDIGLVVNYDVPDDAEDYVHRIGRTARAESTGVAITLINNQDQSKFYLIEQLIGEEIRKLPLPEAIGIQYTYEPRIKKKHRNKFRKKNSYRKKEKSKSVNNHKN